MCIKNIHFKCLKSYYRDSRVEVTHLFSECNTLLHYNYSNYKFLIIIFIQRIWNPLLDKMRVWQRFVLDFQLFFQNKSVMCVGKNNLLYFCNEWRKYMHTSESSDWHSFYVILSYFKPIQSHLLQIS